MPLPASSRSLGASRAAWGGASWASGKSEGMAILRLGILPIIGDPCPGVQKIPAHPPTDRPVLRHPGSILLDLRVGLQEAAAGAAEGEHRAAHLVADLQPGPDRLLGHPL